MKVKYVSATFSVKFPRCETIRRSINDLEDQLNEYYNIPQNLGIPDNVEPRLPRLTFRSKQGHSNINFSQISGDLNVNYDHAFQVDLNKSFKYLQSRSMLILDALNYIDIHEFYYSGVSILINVEFDEKDGDPIEFLINRYKTLDHKDNLFDFEVKYAKVENEKFYINERISNYRTYVVDNLGTGIVPIGKYEVAEKGVAINIDINSRAKFNKDGISVNDTVIKTDLQEINRLLNIEIGAFNKEYMNMKEG